MNSPTKFLAKIKQPPKSKALGDRELETVTDETARQSLAANLDVPTKHERRHSSLNMHCRLPGLAEKATSMARFAINYEENAPITADANRICFSGFYARLWKKLQLLLFYTFFINK